MKYYLNAWSIYNVKILKEGAIFTATWPRYTAVVTQSVCTQLQQYSTWGLTCTPHVKHRLYWPLCPFSQLNSFHRYYGNTAVICCAQGMSTEYFCPLLPRSNWWLSDRLTFTNVLQLKHRPSYIRVNATNVWYIFSFHFQLSNRSRGGLADVLLSLLAAVITVSSFWLQAVCDCVQADCWWCKFNRRIKSIPRVTASR